jgi:hypothetical protein
LNEKSTESPDPYKRITDPDPGREKKYGFGRICPLEKPIPDGKLWSLAECEVLGHSVLHVVCPVFLA